MNVIRPFTKTIYYVAVKEAWIKQTDKAQIIYLKQAMTTIK